MRSAERSARWASGNDLDQGGERGAYVVLETSGLRKRGIAYGTRVLWRRSPHSSRRRDDRPRRAGKPSTGRRGSLRKRARADSWHESAGQVPTRPGRGGTRDAERRDAPGDYPRPRQAKDPGHLPRLPRRHPRGASRVGARRGLRHRRAGCPETGPPGVRREALRCIPDAVRRNLEECSWVTWLT